MPGPPQAAQYDYTPLLQRYERAALILRNPGRKADRFSTAAQALCGFFRVLDEDNAFWDVVERVTGDQPDVRRLFGDLAVFEDQEYEILTRAGLDEFTAAELAGDLRGRLDGYQPGDLPATQNLRNDLRRIGQAVCAAETDLGNRQRRRSRLKLLSRALSIAVAIVAVAADIPLTLAVVGVASVVGGVLMAMQTAADCLADGLNDG
jgi:hypothetical protein